MRTRSKVLSNTITSGHICQVGYGSGSTVDRYAGGLEVKTVEDVTTPEFTRRLRCGEFLPINPVIIRTTRMLLATAVEADLINTNQNFPLKGEFGAWSMFPSTPPTAPVLPPGFSSGERFPFEPDEGLEALAINIARANAVSERWDVLTTLAEARSTIQTIVWLSSGFWKKSRYVAELAHLRFKSRKDRRFAVRDAIEWFSENWLLARYGIRPILYDLQDAQRYLNSLIGDEGTPFVTGRGKQGDSKILLDRHVSNGALGGVYDSAMSYRVITADTYRAKAYLGAQTGWNRGLQIDPFVTAWELVPYSFVLDWVVDIGGWISTLTPLVRGEFLGTSFSFRSSRSWVRTDTISPMAGRSTGTPGESSWRYEVEYYTRVPYSGGTLPQVNLRFTLPKLVDLLALAKRSRSEVFRLLNRR